MKEKEPSKELQNFLTMTDLTVKAGRRAGLTPEMIESGFASRLRRPPQFVGGDVAAEEPAPVPVRDYRDWKAQQKGAGRVELKGYEIGKGGKLVPTSGVSRQWEKHLEDTASSMDNFQRLLHRGLIPQEEIDQARARGITGWRALRKKYGSDNPPVPDPSFGGGSAA